VNRRVVMMAAHVVRTLVLVEVATPRERENGLAGLCGIASRVLYETLVRIDPSRRKSYKFMVGQHYQPRMDCISGHCWLLIHTKRTRTIVDITASQFNIQRPDVYVCRDTSYNGIRYMDGRTELAGRDAWELIQDCWPPHQTLHRWIDRKEYKKLVQRAARITRKQLNEQREQRAST